MPSERCACVGWETLMFTNITGISKLCCSVLYSTRDLCRDVNIVCVSWLALKEVTLIFLERMKVVNSLYCMIYYQYLM